MPSPRFKKGDAKPANSGRQVGVANKNTQLLKDAVLKAAAVRGTQLSKNKAMSGLERYLWWLSKEHPQVFGSLLNKVLPLQIGGKTDTGDGINIQIVFGKEPVKTIEGETIDVTPD